jgi:hypothetical protein
MRTEVSIGGKRIESPFRKKRLALSVPYVEVSDEEILTLGFRANMLEMGKGLGSIDTGTGLGTDFILLRWGKKSIAVRGSELLRAWVRSFKPKDAERFPADVKEL